MNSPLPYIVLYLKSNLSIDIQSTDTYKTITSPSEGLFKDRGSKFLAYAYPVYSESEWQERMAEVRKMHVKARHFCYAFRLGLDGTQFRANDDGEPSGTAGRPILGQIDSFGLTNIIIIVVRYFGGTKLGASGLIQAYRESAAEALRSAQIIEKQLEDVFWVGFDYGLMSNVMGAAKKLEMDVFSQDFGDTARIQIAIRQSQVEDTLLRFKALVAKVRIEEIDHETKIDGLTIDYIETR